MEQVVLFTNLMPNPLKNVTVLSEQVVLPLCSENVAASAPYPQTLLLYGPQLGGKSMLIDALAAECGANVFEIGCRNTDGKYEKKKAAMMMHMVFKVAKALAPSIIKFDEAELTWLSDKKKVKAMGFSEPGSRILKDMAKEMKDLSPADRVVLIGESKQPWLCEKGDQKKFLSFFKLLVYVPICDYGSLQCGCPPVLQPSARIHARAGTYGATTCSSQAFPTQPISSTWTSARCRTSALSAATPQEPSPPRARQCALRGASRAWRPNPSPRQRSRLR
jgi:hypothetical protein